MSKDKYNKPKPDDRSDNAEKLENMIENTLENIDEAEATLEYAEGAAREQILAKNKRRKEAVEGFRSEIKDEYPNQK